MIETMVKMDNDAHSILKKWKENLRQIGIKVPLGATIREMDKLIKNGGEGISQTDIKAIKQSLDKLRETMKKYDRPELSDAIRKMDSIIQERV